MNRGGWSEYSSIHKWIRKQFPRPKVCASCSTGFPIDLANISQQYKRELSDWEWLCRRCHMKKDGRLGRSKYVEDKSVSSPVLMAVRIANREYRAKYPKGRLFGKRQRISPKTHQPLPT